MSFCPCLQASVSDKLVRMGLQGEEEDKREALYRNHLHRSLTFRVYSRKA